MKPKMSTTESPEREIDLAWRVFPTALGRMAAGWTERGLQRLVWSDERSARRSRGRVAEPLAGACQELETVLAAYAEGAPIDPARLDVPLAPPRATPFAAAVREALREVPRGLTTDYGTLAARAGSPRAARAAGSAMAANTLLLIVPCHRVLAANGRLGGFSGPGGVDTKRRLLALEGVHPRD